MFGYLGLITGVVGSIYFFIYIWTNTKIKQDILRRLITYYAALNCKTEREHAFTPLGFCLRVIVNKNPLNFEKTTSSVLSVLLLIYGILEQYLYLS